MSHRIHYCQWEGCDTLATNYIRRGERMKDMLVCRQHTEMFRGLTHAQARDVSDTRTGRRWISASITFGGGAEA